MFRFVGSASATTKRHPPAGPLYAKTKLGLPAVVLRNAKAVSFFNTAANWGSGAGRSAGGDGASVWDVTGGRIKHADDPGNGARQPITVLFEAGALLTALTGVEQRAILCSGQNFITIDGVERTIQTTATARSGNHQVYGIEMLGCSNTEVKT